MPPLHREGIELISDSGLTFTFDDRANKLITGRSGFGMPPVQNRTRRAPYQHGSSWITFRYTPRIINLPFTLMECSRLNMMDLRRSLAQTVNTFGGGMKLKYIYPDGTAYYLNVYYSSGLGWNTASQPNPTTQVAGVQLIAYDPFWYAWDEMEDEYAWDFTEIECFFFREALDHLILPFSFLSQDIDYTFQLTNDGDVPASPVFTVNGMYLNPRFDNEDTGKYLLWEGLVPRGSTLVVNCGEKSVLLDGESAISGKTVNSEFFTLDPSVMGITDGINNVTLAGRQYCGGDAGVEISWRNKYIAL